MSREHNMMTGKGGEFAVISELLFRDFNANILTVDSGIDIAAIKNGQTYLFQVKTHHWNHNGQMRVDLELNKIQEYSKNNNKMFLIIIGRHKNDSNSNNYLIFPIKRIEEYSKRLNVRLNKRGNNSVRFLFTRRRRDGIITLNNCGPVQEYKDAWDLIK